MTQMPLAALVASAESGHAQARTQLFDTLYGELRRLAQRQLRGNAAMTLSPTTLLHETFIAMGSRHTGTFTGKGHFMAYAARAMRGLLIDYVRSRLAQKRGGEFVITSLPTDLAQPFGTDAELDRLQGALEQLGATQPRLAQLIDLKFFCGFSFSEIADLMDVSERTAKRDWEKARLLLHQFIHDAGS